MTNKKPARNPYYFPERLQARLAEIPAHALTLVEAPSGFGKTTAVREYLAAALSRGTRVKWHTCLGESPEKAWAAICGLFRDVDDTVAEGLLELGVPSRETLSDIAALLGKCRCTRNTYLVIDNYQLFEHTVQRALIAALAACRGKKLRLVVITQPLRDDAETTHWETGCYAVFADNFLFATTDIVHYCRLAGIAVSYEDMKRIQNVSEGWIAAIRLQLKAFEDTGSLKDASTLLPVADVRGGGRQGSPAGFLGARAVGALVETAVWNKMSAGEKEFLLGIALLDGFTRQQVAIMGAGGDGPGGSAMPESIVKLLSLDFFIRYVADKKVYSIHSVLRDYLLERFETQPHDVQSALYRRAAAACLAVSDYFQAARFFLKVGDYDAILSMPFTDQYFFNNQEHDIFRFFDRFLQECPSEILLRHPLTLVTVGIQFSKKGMREQYRAIVNLLGEFLENPKDADGLLPVADSGGGGGQSPPVGFKGMPEKLLYKIKGEYHMLLFFSRFNDVAGMGEHHKKAHEYLRHVSDPPRSSIYVGNLPWAIGSPSVVSVYWNKSGGLGQALAAMDECLPFYSDLAGGHGAGGEILMRAEAHFMRGDDAEAEKLCHKTLYVSQNAGQTSNCLCAELILARIGILRGDETMYRAARQNIARAMEAARQTALTRLGEMCLAHLDLDLGDTDGLKDADTLLPVADSGGRGGQGPLVRRGGQGLPVEFPDWLRRTEAIQRTLYAVTQPHAIMLHCHMLLLENRRVELAALAETALETARAMHYPLLQTYHLIFMARLLAEAGEEAEAAARLREALAIALPDRVYLPFAEHAEALLPLLEGLKEEFDRLCPSRMEECLSVSRRWITGVATLRAAGVPMENALLTGRELDVARLVSEGISNLEIAERLHITERTVKAHLTKIFKKTGAQSRSGLHKFFV